MTTHLILGGPGCGKTSYQLGLMEEALGRGVPPDRLAFVSFTKAAVDEARARAMAKFGLAKDSLPYFRTLHSLCFRALGLRRDDVLSQGDWSAIATACGVTFTGKDQAEDALPGDGASEGDRALSLISYARAVRGMLEDVWHCYGEGVRWPVLERLAGTIRAYKENTKKVDFADMLTLFLRYGAPIPVDEAFVDEAQDLTAVQWGVARKAFGRVPVHVSGDDDQAIHTWAGAATRMFQDIQGPRTVLPVSHRLSREVWALGNRITGRIKARLPKTWAPAAHSGSIQTVGGMDAVRIDPKRGSWMILVRNGYQMRDIASALRTRGLPYRTRGKSAIQLSHVRGIVAWERRRKGDASVEEDALEFADRKAPPGAIWFDALTGIPRNQREYYRSILRAGYRLQEEPKILLSTIHGVKGQEADHVVLHTDLTRKIVEQMGDGEHRVFYVGATRARHSLTIIAPQNAALGYTL